MYKVIHDQIPLKNARINESPDNIQILLDKRAAEGYRLAHVYATRMLHHFYFVPVG